MGWQPPAMSDHKLDELLDRIRRAPLVPEGLTGRERDVLACAARGLSVNETAEELGLSWNTVRHHRKNAIAELGARDLTHAVVIFLLEGREDGLAGESNET